jgi:hypothetical protein
MWPPLHTSPHNMGRNNPQPLSTFTSVGLIFLALKLSTISSTLSKIHGIEGGAEMISLISMLHKNGLISCGLQTACSWCPAFLLSPFSTSTHFTGKKYLTFFELLNKGTV